MWWRNNICTNFCLNHYTVDHQDFTHLQGEYVQCAKILHISCVSCESCLCESNSSASSASPRCSKSAAVLPSASRAKRSMPLAKTKLVAFSLFPSTSVERCAARICSAVLPLVSLALISEPASSSIRKASSLGFESFGWMVWQVMLRANLINGVSATSLRHVTSAPAPSNNRTISELLRQAAACTVGTCQRVQDT